jgi:hypothetical protein
MDVPHRGEKAAMSGKPLTDKYLRIFGEAEGGRLPREG